MNSEDFGTREDWLCLFGSRDLWKFDYFIFIKNRKLSLKRFSSFVNIKSNSYTEKISKRIYNHFFSRQRKLLKEYRRYYKFWYIDFTSFLEERYLVHPRIAFHLAKKNIMIVDLDKNSDLGVEQILPNDGCFSLIEDFIKEVN